MKATLGDDRPMPPPMYRARVANAPPPQPARDGPPWHLGTLPNETPTLPTRPATPATRDDVPARASGTAQAESPLGSCPSSIDLPIISSSTSTCLLECGRLCNTCFSIWTAEFCTSEPTLVRHRAAPTRHQRATGVITPPHTRQRSERTNDIAHAPFWREESQ